MVTIVRSEVKSRSHYDIVELHLTKVPAKYQLAVFEIYPEEDFKGQGHHSKVKGQIKATP